jgi:hypothetical protein
VNEERDDFSLTNGGVVLGTTTIGVHHTLEISLKEVSSTHSLSAVYCASTETHNMFTTNFKTR